MDYIVNAWIGWEFVLFEPLQNFSVYYCWRLSRKWELTAKSVYSFSSMCLYAVQSFWSQIMIIRLFFYRTLLLCFVGKCSLPNSRGPCGGNLRKWYFDINMQKCLPFGYGGCQGNDNRFDTMDECTEACSLSLSQQSLPASSDAKG